MWTKTKKPKKIILMKQLNKINETLSKSKSFLIFFSFVLFFLDLILFLKIFPELSIKAKHHIIIPSLHIHLLSFHSDIFKLIERMYRCDLNKKFSIKYIIYMCIRFCVRALMEGEWVGGIQSEKGFLCCFISSNQINSRSRNFERSACSVCKQLKRVYIHF